MVLLVLISMLFSQGEVVLATEIDLLDREKGMAETDYPLTYQGDEERQVKSIESDSSFYTERSLVPSRYESPYVTSVKDQNPYGTCWAFATLAASEANMVKSGLYDKNSIDLSEWHLAYFMAHSVADPLRGTNGDTFDLLYTSQSPNYMQRGGNEEIAAKKMANWQGPVKEEIASYEIIKSVYDPDGTDADLDVQASISEDNAFNDAAHLENSWYVSMKDRNVVKSLIMECGAAATSYYSSDPNLDVVDYYKYSNPSDGRPTINNTEIVKTNHAITLVGWDDNFSKEYFTIKPSNNGAWLCKNSWGNWGKDGYFWISYEDVAINTRNAIFYQYGKADNYEYNYQYDGGVFNGYKYYPDRDSMYAANMFQANTGEVLKAVGFYTVDPNYKCSISIYKDCEEGKPVSGKQVAYMEDIEELYVGYHTEKLDTKVFLEKGCRFSVVVRYETLDGAEARAVIEEESFGEWYKSSVSAKAGQSFISWDGQESNWKDIGISDRKNLRIKAFTNSAILSTSVFLNTTNRVMLEGDTFQLTANVKPENASWKAIQWSSSKPDVASVDDNGLVTAKKAGVAEITAEAVDGSSVKAECVITVEKKEIKVSGIRLNKERETLAEGDRLKLTATVSPSDATNKEIEWSSSVAGVATVDGTGLVTAQKPGRAVITVTAQDGSGVSTSCEITVEKREIKVNGIRLNKERETLTEGDTLKLTATVSPSDATNKEIEWSSSVAGVATVDGTGLVTAQKPGRAVITVTAQDGSGVSTSCEITVEKREIKVNGIRLNKERETLTEGDTLKLTATVSPSDATNKEIEWSSSVAGVATVDGTGLVTAQKPGRAVITAEAKNGSGVSASCEITVKKKEEEKIKVSGITLNKTKEKLKEGDTVRFTATVFPENASNKEVTWSSKDAAIASVDETGLVTAKKEGKTIITATAQDGNGVSASCEITVEKKEEEEIKVSGITLDKTKEILTEGDTIQLTATVRPEEASNQELEWSSSDRNVVTVNERGLVTALKEGKAIITATAQDGSGVKADCEITVKGKEEKKIKVSGITLSKTKEILQVNQTLKLTATVSPVNASNKELIWSSSNTNVATVDAAGLITAKSTGKAYITTIAKDGSGVCASCEIVVEKKPDETPQPVPESPEKDPALSYKKAIAKSTVLFLNDNLYYTGKAVIPQVRVSFNGQELALNADYTLSYENNINIGNAKLIIQGIGAFRGTKIVAFPIKAKTGTKFSYKKGKYKVLNASEVSYLGLTSTKTKKVQVPQTVIFGNKHFKVTQIADKALKNTKVTSVIIGDQVNCIGQSAMEGCKSLNQVVIGRNVSIIGNKAFCKCKKLKKITIYSSKLKANKIGSKTFKGIYANARVEVPVGKVKEYKKWLKSKGAGSKIRVVEK